MNVNWWQQCSVVWVLFVPLLLGATSVTANQASERAEVTLKYAAYIAGINSGEANLTLARSTLANPEGKHPAGHRYKVSGKARSLGLWESIQKWRAEYSVEGVVRQTIGSEGVEPGHFYSLQTTPRKRREIHIERGVLKETKNHKVRDPRPAQTGFDLLSALFFLPACLPEVRVHTGRDGYDMRRIRPALQRPGGSAVTQSPVMPASSGGAPSCRYEVIDEDGDRYQLSMKYARRSADPRAQEPAGEAAHGGSAAAPVEFLVPSEIALRGPVAGRLVLAPERSAKSPR